MMRFVSIAAVIVAVPTFLSHQPNQGASAGLVIAGVVTDSNVGHPIYFATIRVWHGGPRRCTPSPESSTITNRRGAFSLTLPEPGRYFVCAGAIGYAWRGLTLTVPNDSSGSLSLRLPQNPVWIGP